MTRVSLSRRAQKELERVPAYIKLKLLGWIESVLIDGLEETRKHVGYHDELLKGERAGQRSIRLNQAYRAIYVVFDAGMSKYIEIVEVTHHEY